MAPALPQVQSSPVTIVGVPAWQVVKKKEIREKNEPIYTSLSHDYSIIIRLLR